MMHSIFRWTKSVLKSILGRVIASPEDVFAIEKFCAQHNGKCRVAACAMALKMSPVKVLQGLRLLQYVEKRKDSFSPPITRALPGGKVYFKTIFYAPLELPFIKMNLVESLHYVDKFIVVEGNRTHVGEPREYIFERYISAIPAELRHKILYIKADIAKDTVDCTGSNDGCQMHSNENVLWDSFEKYVDLQDNDIVISADADEVIYRKVYPLILNLLRPERPLILPLHQFFYRMNYLWKNETFWAPTAAYAGYYNRRPHPHKWRYDGKKFPIMAGCHFSWQLTIEQMLFKLKTYAHNDIYGHLADRKVLQDAVDKKKYPFDPDRHFVIDELSPDNDQIYYPESFFIFRSDFDHLLPVKSHEA